jgi:hypothetical protein
MKTFLFDITLGQAIAYFIVNLMLLVTTAYYKPQWYVNTFRILIALLLYCFLLLYIDWVGMAQWSFMIFYMEIMIKIIFLLSCLDWCCWCIGCGWLGFGRCGLLGKEYKSENNNMKKLDHL